MRELLKKFKLIDYILEIIGLLAIIFMVILVFKTYPELPDVIAKHWDYRGWADRWGDKRNFLTAPILVLLLHLGMTFLVFRGIVKGEFPLESKSDITLFRLTSLMKLSWTLALLHDVYMQSAGFLDFEPVIGDVNQWIKFGVCTFLTILVTYKGVKRM